MRSSYLNPALGGNEKMPPTNELHRLMGKVEEFMSSTKEDIRELREELKARDRQQVEQNKAFNETISKINEKLEKKRGPWIWFLIPGLGGGGAAAGMWGKSVTASIAKFLGS